ncbi:Acetyltransferase involved in cellulose biosynthesis, CelD/BcsL family [Neorhodopirellula lusitana]|uniref:Acetyltransferase involved in cellulose biosynthesis, CelD/BcsL family n=1 Tax=Neorhodopirellula lusitana TaxID=445327 RepID=A0ABY1QJ47_9BACT|nr:GNAT family N-acetyltransferase [Neorhodopirellula lusitana]SMP70656.1 Acetyltransferase involved in cellulose biosynthesis, CelD/BcsL family [Neorhodopirellula lusitana]
MNTPIAYRAFVSAPEDLLLQNTDLWDGLSGGVPFRQTTWLRAWWNQYGKDQATCFITVVDQEDRVCGILPLCRLGRRGWTLIAAGHACSDHVSILSREDDQDGVAEALARFLVDHATDSELGWNRLAFDGVVAGDPGMRKLSQHLTDLQSVCRIQTRMSVWFKACEKDWAAHLERSSRRTRNRLRMMVDQFDKPDSTFAVRFADDEKSVKESLDVLIRLHQSHWQAKGESGSYATAGMVEMIHEAAIDALHRGTLFLPRLVQLDPATSAETILATQLHFIGDDQRLYCFSTGVNYDYSDLSPGTMLNNYLLYHAHEHGYAGIDFMRGDEAYKARLKAQPNPVLLIELFPPTLSGKMACTLYDNVLSLKQKVRQRRGTSVVATPTIEEAFAEHYRQHLPRTGFTVSDSDPEGDIGIIDLQTICPQWMQAANEAQLESTADDREELDDDSGPVILPITMPLTDSSFNNIGN